LQKKKRKEKKTLTKEISHYTRSISIGTGSGKYTGTTTGSVYLSSISNNGLLPKPVKESH
jgi:hypothetical protein